jgi:subtilase family protein
MDSTRELVVLTRSDAMWGPGGPPAMPPGAPGPAGPPAMPLGAEAVQHAAIASVLRQYNASIRPLFHAGPGANINADLPAAPARAAHPSRVYNRIVADDSQLDTIADALRNLESVDAAYVKPPSEPPTINKMQATAPPAPPQGTPDLSPRQDYFRVAPGGIDAQYAWTQQGGKGAGVNIVDVEGAWRLTHEALLTNNRGLLSGAQSSDIVWRNHGTAVAGVFSATENMLGVTGICPDAKVGVVAIFGDHRTTSLAIREAADKLSAGDILLIELHRAGPRNGYEQRDDQNGYIAVEWWPDDFDAIQYAVGRGVIVIEPAGNGAQDLDDALYETPKPGFPPDWRNPFRRGNSDSGAILVGAGAPPPNTHGNDHGPDRSRLDFSNYGSAVDVQGWGREVTTCGYGDLQAGINEDHWYTDQFSGTSSASPVVVGALGCVQGVRHAAELPLLTPATARALLRSTGSPQQDAPGRPRTQRIGNRPDLRQMLARPAVA